MGMGTSCAVVVGDAMLLFDVGDDWVLRALMVPSGVDGIGGMNRLDQVSGKDVFMARCAQVLEVSYLL